jgi:hypothetical protein
VKQFNAVVNGDFENGLTAWTVSGAPAPIVVVPKTSKKKKNSSATLAPVTPAHAAQIGTSNGVGDFALSQLVTVPTGTTGLSFWYQPHCTNKTTDTFKAQIRDAGGVNVLQTLISACTNSSTWAKGAFDTSLYAGQDVTLWFGVHSAKSKKAVYVLLDDVVVGRQPAGVANGGFETGDLTGWSPAGYQLPSVVSTTPHTGTSSALLGAGGSLVFTGDSTLSQAVIVPGINPTLTVWYFPHCRDTIAFDQIQIKIKSPGGQVLSTLLNSCPSSTTSWRWTKGTYNLSAYAGQSVTIWMNVHDDGAPGDETWAQFDDIALAGG